MFHAKKIQKGNRISARDYNEIRKTTMNIDASRITARSHHTTNPVIVRVRNVTEQILPEFSVVGIKTPMYEKDNALDFNNQGTAYGVELEARPWDGQFSLTEDTPFGVLCKRAAPDALVDCVVMGPTPVQLTHYDPAYPYALPTPNITDSIRAMPYGPARIIWVDTEHPEMIDQCDPRPRNAYINIGDAQWWQFYELQEELTSCSSADSIACYHCGGQIGPCEIHRIIWLPKLGCDDGAVTLPPGTIILAHWYEQENKWIAINWRETCPDFDVFTPETSSLITISQPARFEWTVGNDPCVDNCTINLVCNDTKYYKNDCGLFCQYDTSERRIPWEFPFFPGEVPVSCLVSEAERTVNTDCECTGGRQIQIQYPEIQVRCGKICDTGVRHLSAPCDISLTQDTPITQYDHTFQTIPGEGECACSTLRITPKTRTAKIACDEWCYSDWTDGEPIEIPLPAENGGELTYLDNIAVETGDSCGTIKVTKTFATAEVHCGQLCEPTSTVSTPETITLPGDTSSLDVVTDVELSSGTLNLQTEPKTALADVDLNLSNVTLTGGAAQTIVTDVTPSGSLTLTGGVAQTVITDVNYTPPTLSGSTQNINVVTGAAVNQSSLSLSGTDKTFLTSANLDATKISLTGTEKTLVTGGSVNLSGLTVTVPLTQITGGTVNGSVTISIPMQLKEVVTNVSVENCNVVGTKENVWVLNPASAENGDTSLNITATFSGTLTPTTSSTTATGAISGTATFSPTTETVSIPTGISISSGFFTTTTEMVSIPTGIAVGANSIALTQSTVSVVTSASLTAGALTATTADITIPTAAAFDSQSLSVTTDSITIPTEFSGVGALDKTTVTINEVTGELEDGAINSTKRTLQFTNGVLCGGDE